MAKGTRMDKGNGLKIVVILIILSVLLFIGALTFGIYWDSFRNPPGDEQSVPAPKIN